jgi:hypothetical protein
MNNYYIFAFVLLAQLSVFYIDNLSMLNLVSDFKLKNSVARGFNKRSRTLVVRSGFSLIAPPILGYLLSRGNLDVIYYLFISTTFLSLFITQYQWNKFKNKLHHNYIFKLEDFNSKRLIHITIGIFAFSLHLNFPFIINIVASYFSNESLWIVQLNPILTSISTFYVIFIYDRKLSIDMDNKHIKPININEIYITRMIGRFFAFILSLVFFYHFVSL